MPAPRRGSYAFATSTRNTNLFSIGGQSGLVSICDIALALTESPFGCIKNSGYGSGVGMETFDGEPNTKLVAQLN
jgi:succinate-semialdehyde dehydrogenase / glutarate-semialdehyde dehydrogenase